MPASKAQQKAQNKWIAKAYDRINLTVPKGRKDEIQSFAAQTGESVNGFINRAIGEAMGNAPQEPAEAHGGGGAIPFPGNTGGGPGGRSKGRRDGPGVYRSGRDHTGPAG